MYALSRTKPALSVDVNRAMPIICVLRRTELSAEESATSSPSRYAVATIATFIFTVMRAGGGTSSALIPTLRRERCGYEHIQH